jgi:UDP-N-acetylglucosamine acyltransferase
LNKNSNTKIHSTAIIGNNVEISSGVEIGAYSIIYDNVKIGKNTKIYSHCVIGSDIEYKGRTPANDAGVIIGDNCIIREFVTINNNITEHKTKIGNGCYIMTKSHIGHDSILGDNVLVCSSAIVGGHSKIGNFCYLGLGSVLHPFSEIDDLSLIAAQAFFKGKSPKGILWAGIPSRAININIVGIDRNIEDENYKQELLKNAKEFLQEEKLK